MIAHAENDGGISFLPGTRRKRSNDDWLFYFFLFLLFMMAVVD